MGEIASRLRDSRLSQLIESYEKGETVDLERVTTLQALDLARDGELVLAEALEREDQAHEQLEQLLDGAE